MTTANASQRGGHVNVHPAEIRAGTLDLKKPADCNLRGLLRMLGTRY